MTENNMTAEDYFNRGNVKINKQDYDGAITDYTQAIQINPYYEMAYGNRGLAKDKKQDYDGAITDYTQAIELNPDDAWAYFCRGLAKYCKKNYDGAIADCTKAIEIYPYNANLYFCRGLAKEYKKDYDGAITDFSKAIAINPECPSFYANRGFTKNNKKDYDGAITDYTWAIQINPYYEMAYYNRGLAKAHKKDYEGAIADYKEAFSLTNYPLSSEQIFYRFRPLNQYTLEAFILNKFFVADPETFNDPFDSILLKKDALTLEYFNQNIRIASFASKNDNEECPLENILLWSYYAQDHKGIAIGYKFNPEKFNQHKAFLKNVHYRKELIQDNWNNIFEEAYLAKFENWRHEQEWRFVYLKEDKEEDPVLLDMTQWGIKITEIIFGLSCHDHQCKMIYHLFQQKNPDVMPDFYQMERTKDNIFGLKKEEWKFKG